VSTVWVHAPEASAELRRIRRKTARLDPATIQCLVTGAMEVESTNFLGKWLAILDGFRNWALKLPGDRDHSRLFAESSAAIAV
jgi:hypothetical protein